MKDKSHNSVIDHTYLLFGSQGYKIESSGQAKKQSVSGPVGGRRCGQ